MFTNALIADRVEIADLFTRFVLLLDERRWEDADTVFSDDVAVHSPRGGELHGIDKVVAFMRESEVEGQHTQHTTTDLLVNVDGDHATASANSLVYYFRDGQAPHFTGGLRLAGTAVRTPAGWRLREIRIMPAWTRETEAATATAPAVTLNPKIVGQAEKHHTAVLARALSGTTVDEKQWITLNQALATGAPVDRSAHAARVAAMTQWPEVDVDNALAALIKSGLAHELSDGKVEITDAGRALSTKVRTESGRILEHAYGAVSPEDLATAARVLTTITAQMAEELSRTPQP